MIQVNPIQTKKQYEALKEMDRMLFKGKVSFARPEEPITSLLCAADYMPMLLYEEGANLTVEQAMILKATFWTVDLIRGTTWVPRYQEGLKALIMKGSLSIAEANQKIVLRRSDQQKEENKMRTTH